MLSGIRVGIRARVPTVKTPGSRHVKTVMQGLGRPKMGARLVGRTHRGLNTQAGRRGGIGVTGAVVGATALVGSAVGIGSWYLGVTVDDWKYNLGLKVAKVRPRARDLPTMVPPEEYIHPYSQRSLLWQWSFTIQRALYLLYLMCPLAVHSMRLLIWDGDIAIRDRWCEVLVDFLNNAGCTFQKFGQWMSMRPDIFPDWLIKSLGELREDTPVHSYPHTVKVIEDSLGLSMDEIFVSIEHEPVASGSVGQVHRAVLREKYALSDGKTDVAVKVRHPSVLDQTFVDFHLVFNAIPVINFLLSPLSSDSDVSLSMPFARDSLINTVQKQLDFKWEAYNLLEFCHNFAREQDRELAEGEIRVSFPVVSTELLADAVLVESWAPGKTIAAVYDDVATRNSEMASKLASTVFEITIKMFLRDNFIHGDLHAGNMLFDAETMVVTVMDAGLVTHLPDDVWNEFGDFLRAMCSKDILEVRDKLIFFHDENIVGGRPKSEIDPVYLEQDIADIYQTGGGSNRPDIPLAQALGDIVGDVLKRVGRHGIVLRSDVASAILSISVAEGVIFQLDPELDVLRTALPYFVKYQGWDSAEDILQSSYFSSERQAKDIVSAMSEKVSGVSTAVEELAGVTQPAPAEKAST